MCCSAYLFLPEGNALAMRLDDATVIICPICLCQLDLSILETLQKTYGFRFQPAKAGTIKTSRTLAICHVHRTKCRVSTCFEAGVSAA